jgi:hypothetical protein
MKLVHPSIYLSIYLIHRDAFVVVPFSSSQNASSICSFSSVVMMMILDGLVD